MSEQDTYDLAVVFDSLWVHFDEVSRELGDLFENLTPTFLQHLDIAYLEPSTLVCRLCFHSTVVSPTRLADRLSVAQTRHFRVLDLMSISGTDGENVYDRQLAGAVWTKSDSQDPRADLAELREQAKGDDDSDRRSLDRVDFTIPVRFVGGPEPAVGLATNVSANGLYVESDVIPDLGAELVFYFQAYHDTRLEHVRGRVVRRLSHLEAREQGKVPGFAAQLDERDARSQQFASFLVYAARGRPWPERSGRLYERFRMEFPVTYTYDGEEHRESTTNVSRGGLYVASQRPPPEGVQLAIDLHSDDAAETGVTFEVVVTHQVLPEEVAHAAVIPGLGLRFLDSPADVEAKMERLLSKGAVAPERRVLLVDDDSFFRRVVGGGFRHAGFEVLEAASGEQAYKLLVGELLRVDAILVDYYLPGMSAQALIDWIRRADAYSDIAVAIITAADLDDNALGALEPLRVGDVIPKDLALEEMVARIAALTE